MMKLRQVVRSVRRVPEALLIALALAVLPWLPRSWLVRCARGAGSLAMRLSGKLRRIGRANLDLVFGHSLSDQEKNDILRTSFQTFALVVFDLFWFGAFTMRRIERYVRFDASMRFVLERKPLVALTAHLGNWEILGQACAARGAPLFSVAAPVANPFADWMLTRMRRRTGQRIAEQAGALKVLIRTLRQGDRVALLLDQNTLPREGGEFVDFFGVPAPMSKAVAALVRKTAVEAVLAVCVPDERGDYTAYALPPLEFGGQPESATQVIARSTEEFIRRFPGCWLWMYKRWKYIPAGAERAGYPFYARELVEDGKQASHGR